MQFESDNISRFLWQNEQTTERKDVQYGFYWMIFMDYYILAQLY